MKNSLRGLNAINNIIYASTLCNLSLSNRINIIYTIAINWLFLTAVKSFLEDASAQRPL